ncbi:fungal-specific transcription factor domain-containing protein [Gamsiella multidivaricata]|uniref:fungal-specific transcription factor domain-containing protein n=1 Tax=Gamsiella multidivaricata TaxID=101098 RepID=UPI00221FDD32|nr:fungal-specific transcription factor domain-containing protein [Gamsiella multidivaricata]KAG0365251.1 hypothetical protein BGZ54_006723 [Gamsiella multidivaricata]KAI7829689.1 fungal-specific transcription factor domain-containing protein [Gamsiella multidivaricata]
MTSQEQLDAKRRRVSRACDTCRRKKVRCDGVQPSCTNCTTFGFQCTFNDSAKKRGPPKGYIEALENRLHRMENLLGGLVQGGGDRVKVDLDNWHEEHEDDLDVLDSASWSPHSPDTPTVKVGYHKQSIDSNLSTGTAASMRPITSNQVCRSPDAEDKFKEEDEEGVMEYDRDARAKINALSDRMDSMSLDNGGFIRYLGNSSGIDLLQRSQLLRSGYLLVPIKVRDHQEWLTERESAVANLASEMPLPPRDLAEHLIKCYWTYVHPHIPIVHKSTFMKQYQNPDPGKRPPIVLLTAMFSIASRFSDHPEIIGHGHDPEGFGDEYFDRAKRLVDLEYELPRQSSIQALLLMTAYRFTSAKSGGRVWVMLGMATRMAQDMGMHRNSARWHLPPLETEIRKRLWWALYQMDRWVSASMGRPMSIDDNDCDVDFPSALEEDWAELEGGSPATTTLDNGERPKEETSFSLDYFVEMIKLSQILGQVLKRIYGATTRNHGPLQISSTAAELDTTLTNWLLALPSDLKYDHRTMANSGAKINRWVASIHSAYYTVLILLHRPYMTPTSLTQTKLSESLPSLNIAVSAANSITYLLGKLDEDDNLRYTWHVTTYEVFTSSMIHLTNSASVNIRLQTQARNNLIKNISYMKKLGRRWFHSAKFSLILEDLMCAHLNFDAYQTEGRSMEAVPIAKVGEFDITYPIILRDQSHPSGGSLLFAPKASTSAQTPPSASTTPGSSPSMAMVHHPDAQDTSSNKLDGSGSDTPSAALNDSTVTPALTSRGGQSAANINAAQTAVSRSIKKSRKPSSQRNSLLFHSNPSSPISTSSSSSSTLPAPSTPSSSSSDQSSLFLFSSLSTPGMFAQGQAFMDYEQMMTQQQLQLHQFQSQDPQQLQQQSFSATPLLSSPFALQFKGPATSGQGQQPSLLPVANAMPSQHQDQQRQQGQQYMQFQQQALGEQNLPQQLPPQSQNGSFGYMNTGVSTMDSISNSNNNAFGFLNNNNGNSNSAIPSGGQGDYSNLSLFPPQQQQSQQQDFAVGVQNPNTVATAAVPNPFFGIPNTIDWDEWNQYIASSGLQKF